MANKIKDLSGMRFGRLTAVESVAERTRGKSVVWLCRCDCGVEKQIAGPHLRSGTIKSCGCAHHIRTHGDSVGAKTVEYRTWKNIRSRCNNPSSPAFHNYGGRGITVAERWNVYENFLADMGRRPSPSHTIDRIDNNLGYSLENCRWATRAEQSRNTRRTIILTHNGESMCIADWAERVGRSHECLRKRHAAGLPVEQVIYGKH